jgi:Beta-galactosidase
MALDRIKTIFKFIGIFLLLLALFLSVALFYLAQKPVPQSITYGMSFNTMYARELGLDWKQTYDAILDDLKVRHFRLAAHWPMVEPEPNVYNFAELDYQIKRAEETHSTVVLAVGRRLPRWPECHLPSWAQNLSAEERNRSQIAYMETVINRYKHSKAVTVWQIENEPFLSVFAHDFCGNLDTNFLDREIALAKSLDGTRPILVTDSGNIGTWQGAYSRGDMFGTSVYVYFWNPQLGQFRTYLAPWFYRVKDNAMALLYGKKKSVLIELSAEPWLIEPVENVPLETQFTRMNLEKFEDILNYAKDTRFDEQYLWGAEWWYWLSLQNHPEMWNRGKELFAKEGS